MGFSRSTKSATGYIPTLDGWRSIAIGGVIASHGLVWSGAGLAKASAILHWPGLGAFLEGLGERGVELFFVLSGFLICSRLIEENDRFGHISLKGFYVRRACRILPAALLYLSFIGILGLAKVIPVTRGEWLSAVFFFRNYYPGQHWYTGHFWSLAVEEHFYLLWPSALFLVGTRRARWVAAMGICAVVIWRGLNWQLMGEQFRGRTDVRLDALLCGCLAALLFSHVRATISRGYTFYFFALALVAYLILGAVEGPWLTVAKLCQAVATAFIILTTVINRGWSLSRFFETRILRLGGKLSYSLYLWQQIFFYPTGHAHRWELPVRLALLVCAAGLSYKLVEKPMIKLGHSLCPPSSPGRDDLPTEEKSAAVTVAG